MFDINHNFWEQWLARYLWWQKPSKDTLSEEEAMEMETERKEQE